MAKKEVDYRIAQLINYGKSNSLMKPFSDVTMISETTFNGKSLIYMIPKEDAISDSFMLVPYDCSGISKRLIHVTNMRSYNKYLKKTMSKCIENPDGSLTFLSPNKGIREISMNESTDIGEIETATGNIDTIRITLEAVNDEHIVTRKYRKLFVDKELTQAVFTALENPCWIKLDNEVMTALCDDESVSLNAGGTEIYFTKALFGQVKRSISIHYCVIDEPNQSDNDTVLILFAQEESAGTLYHLIRFLTLSSVEFCLPERPPSVI